MKSVKLVHVIGALIAGGAERFVVSLVKKLKAEGVDVSLWVLSTRCDAAGAAMVADLRAAGIPCQTGPTFKVGWQTLFWYRKLLSDKQPDVIHLHTPNTELAHFLCGEWIDRFSFVRRGLFRTLHNSQPPESWILRKAYRGNRSLCSIACGRAVEEQYSGKIVGPLKCIENGVDFSHPIKTRELAISLRHKLGMDPDGYHFVNVGRMSGDSLTESAKAHDTLLHAWRQSELGLRHCYLHLLGDGNLRSQLVDLSGGDPSIVFHGVRENVQPWLQAADCFVMPSRSEGLPIAGIEAIGAGLPCIFTNIPPLRELSPPEAMWCQVDDVVALAENLHLAYRKRAVPSPADVEVFREKNSISRTAQQYRHVYQVNGYPT
jgi:glycosyltransferase involved in cell wall biosynthesis